LTDDDKRRELDDKITSLVATRFGGDYHAAFAHYDSDGDGTIDTKE
jgi:hypothetical protein